MDSMGAEDFSALEARVSAVEKVQAVNLPKMLGGLRRLARLEKAMQLATASVAKLTLEGERQLAVSQANGKILTENTAKIEAIYGFITRTRTIWGWARHHSPKAFAFLIGLAISRGWISAENGHSFLSIFGL